MTLEFRTAREREMAKFYVVEDENYSWWPAAEQKPQSYYNAVELTVEEWETFKSNVEAIGKIQDKIRTQLKGKRK